MSGDHERVFAPQPVEIPISNDSSNDARPLPPPQGAATPSVAEPVPLPVTSVDNHTELDLLNAVRRKEIELYYQPVVDTSSRRPIGAEALLRWCHPSGAILDAERFADLADHTGVMAMLGTRSLQRACEAARTWSGNAVLRVNANAQQLAMAGFAQAVSDALVTTELPPVQLTIEITETQPLARNERVRRSLLEIRDLGVGIELDDFGTGYGSALLLRSLPITGIKIDRAFVAGIGRDHRDEIIIRHLVSLAHDLNIEVCGEGVERLEQLEFLADLGAQSVQGFLFGRAMPERVIAEHFDRAYRGQALPFWKPGIAQ